jgi:hypothetical protein
MKRSMHSVGLAFGCAGLLAAAGGCSRERPAQQPSSPAFEANVGTTSDQGMNEARPRSTGEAQKGQQGGTGQQGEAAGQSGHYPGQQGTGQGASAGQQPGESQGAQPGTLGGTGQTNTSVNEREACDTLAHEAILHVENIQSGAAIVAKVRRGVDLSTLREHVGRIEHGISSGGQPSSGEQCDLFTLGRSGMTMVAEGPDSVRILIMTADPSKVGSLRRQANDFVRAHGQ